MKVERKQWLREGREEGLEQGREEGREQGLEQGREEGIEEAFRMLEYLQSQGRYDDFERAAKDEAFREKILEEMRTE